MTMYYIIPRVIWRLLPVLYLLFSVSLSFLTFLTILYLSYLNMFILYKGLSYNLVSVVLKSSLFFLVCYISIISDILLLSSLELTPAVIKNILFILLISMGMYYAREENQKDVE